MKRVLTLVAAAFCLAIGFSNSASAQVEEGNIIIDPYYGYPNIGQSFFDLFVDENNVDGAEIRGIGPCGVRAEFMLADNFGIGIDFIYNSAGAEGSYTDTTGGTTQTYTDNVLMQRIRVLLRLNYHFVQTDALDAYVGGGAGYLIGSDSNPDLDSRILLWPFTPEVESEDPTKTKPPSLSDLNCKRLEGQK